MTTLAAHLFWAEFTANLVAGQTYAFVMTSFQPDDTGTQTISISQPVLLVLTVSGTVSGLAAGNTLVLSDGANNIAVAANGGFSSPRSYSSGEPYQISISTQPAGQTCTVNSGSGTIASDSVADVRVVCTGGFAAGATPIPTLAEWSLLLLVLAMAGVAAVNLRQRS